MNNDPIKTNIKHVKDLTAGDDFNAISTPSNDICILYEGTTELKFNKYFKIVSKKTTTRHFN